MAGKNGKIRQYRKPLNINLGIIIFSVIFIYIIICVFLYFTQKQIQPYEVRTGSLSMDSVYQGIALREETIVSSTDSGYINYYAREGERVGAGKLVCSVDESGELKEMFEAGEAEDGQLSADDLEEVRDEVSGFMESFDRIDYIKAADIPNIDLYMDQVLTFMDRKLRSAVRPQTEDRVLTKTMINNYAKNDLLPPPVKKKYSKEHVLMLIFIYYYKGVIPMNEIQTLLQPITDHYFQNGQAFDLESLYKEVVSLEKEQLEDLKKDVVDKFRRAENSFTETSGEEREFLQKFALICLLSFDVYMKKMIVEQLVAELANDAKAREPEKETHKKNKEK